MSIRSKRRAWPRPPVTFASRRHASLREEYPVCFAFGNQSPAYLDQDQAAQATADQRIRSVWPFLVQQVLRFAETLTPRARANFDPEDVLTELYILLREKDEKWSPERGKYLTFVASITANELHAIRDRSYTVQAPRNSSCRIKEYESEQREGRLTPRRSATLAKIRKAQSDHHDIVWESYAGTVPASDVEAVDRETRDLVEAAILDAMQGLTSQEADAIGRAYGLFGQQACQAEEIALLKAKGTDWVKKVRSKATAKIREYLDSRAPAWGSASAREESSCFE